MEESATRCKDSVSERKMDEEIYVSEPDGVFVNGIEDIVYLLHKEVYG